MKVKLLFFTLFSFQGIFAMGGPGAGFDLEQGKDIIPSRGFIGLPPELQTHILTLNLKSTNSEDLQTIEQIGLFNKKLLDPFLTEKQRKSIVLYVLKKFTIDDFQSPTGLLSFLNLLVEYTQLLSQRVVVHDLLIPLIKNNFIEKNKQNFQYIATARKKGYRLTGIDEIIALIKKALFLSTADPSHKDIYFMNQLFPKIKQAGNSIQDVIDAQIPRAKKGNFLLLFINSLEGIDNLPNNIAQLNLSNNLLKNIPPHAFDKIGPRLKNLLLSYNDLDQLPENLFEKLVNLEALYLNNNQINTLPLNLIKNLKNLKRLMVDDATNVPEEVKNFLNEIGAELISQMR